MMRHYLLYIYCISQSAPRSAWAWFVCIYAQTNACERARVYLPRIISYYIEAILQLLDCWLAVNFEAVQKFIHSTRYMLIHSYSWEMGFLERCVHKNPGGVDSPAWVVFAQSAAMGEHWAFLFCILFRCPFRLRAKKRAIISLIFEQTRKIQQLQQTWCLLFYCRRRHVQIFTGSRLISAGFPCTFMEKWHCMICHSKWHNSKQGRHLHCRLYIISACTLGSSKVY